MKLSNQDESLLDALLVLASLNQADDLLANAALDLVPTDSERELEQISTDSEIDNSLLDALVVAALRTPSDIEAGQTGLDSADREELDKLAANLVEAIMEKVDARGQKPLLFFENQGAFAAAFDRLVSWDAFRAKMAPYLLEASRALTEQEFKELEGARLIDHATEIADLPKPARLYIHSAFRLSEASSSPHGAGAKWNAPGFTPPKSL